jgi:hypothetical protein
VDFKDAVLTRCVFCGALKDVEFSQLVDVDLSEAIMHGPVALVDLSRVTLPRDPETLYLDDTSMVERARAYFLTKQDDRNAHLDGYFILVREWVAVGPVLLSLRDHGEQTDLIRECWHAAGAGR